MNFFLKGFFFTVCFEAVLKIAYHSFENEIIFSLNFSEKFVADFYKKVLAQVIPYVDILFCNDEVFYKASNRNNTVKSPFLSYDLNGRGKIRLRKLVPKSRNYKFMLLNLVW